jgi:HipA-like protein
VATFSGISTKIYVSGILAGVLEGLLQSRKINRRDFFSQLLAVGADTVGAVTIEAMP